MKRWFYLVHRWLGVALCLLMAMWFVSGVVMMYVGYPKLTEAERLQHLPPLLEDVGGPLLPPAQALAAAGIDAAQVQLLQLSRARGARAIYQVERGKPPPLMLDAHTGQSIAAGGVDAALAQASAQAFAGPQATLIARGAVMEDTNTNSSALDPHRPLWRFDLAQGPLARVYVSSLTGEVLRDVSRTELRWNWAGAWAHWLYLFSGNWLDGWRVQIINWSALISMVLVATGAVVGLWRWRFRTPYKNGARTPYPSRLMRWHHVFGLLFMASTMTWLFSGLMSMRPWGLLDSGPAQIDVAAMQGGGLDASALAQLPWQLADATPALREVRWQPLLGTTVATLHGPQGRMLAWDLRRNQPFAPDGPTIVQAATRLSPAPLADLRLLQDYDLYYYDRAAHTMTGGRHRPLPVYRLQWRDAAGTWVHVDARTGEIIGTLDAAGRRSRWLFAMLHSWDWLPLLHRRPLWDAVLLLLSAGGIVLSGSGIVIAWRRLRKKGAGMRRHPAARR